MSLDATRWAWVQEISPTSKLVLLSLADRADDNHYCFPSVNRLEKDTGLYRETIMKNIKELESQGLITVVRMIGSGNKYHLNGVADRHKTSMEKPTSSKKPTSMVLPTTQSEKADRYQSEKADSNLPIESTKEPNSKFDPRLFLRSLNVEEDLIEDVLVVRKKLKAVETKRSYIKIEKEAAKAGITFSDALTIMVERSWRGFNAEWVTGNQVKVIDDKLKGAI